MATDRREELLLLIPAHALGALDADERAALEAWLPDDPEGQALLADYRAVAEHLVALAPLHPAPGHLQDDLRRRLAADVDRAAVAQPASRRPIAPRSLLHSPRTWLFATAAILTLVLFGGLLLRIVSTDDDTPRTAAELYEQLLDQAGSTQYPVVAGEVDDTVMGTLVVSLDGAQAVLRLSSLPPLKADHTFQMWLIDANGARTNAGLFGADDAVDILHIEVPLTQPIAAYKGVGVSLEPAGGSPYVDRPSGPRVLSISLS